MRDPEAPAALHLPQVGGDIYDELVRRLGYQPQATSEPAASYDGLPEPTSEASPFEPSPFEPSPFEPSPFEPSPFGGASPQPAPAASAIVDVDGVDDADDEQSPFGSDLGADLFEGAPADDVWDTEPLAGSVADHPPAPVLGSTAPAPRPLDRSTDPFYATLPAMPPLASGTGRA